MLFFLPAMRKLLAVVVKRLFSDHIAFTIKDGDWLDFESPLIPKAWNAIEKEELLDPTMANYEELERCECHPGYVCHTCQRYYERRRAYAPIPF